MTPIPLNPSVVDDSSHCPDEEDWEDMPDPEELGRAEKRRMFLQGLRNLVPELEHAPVAEAQASGHFSLLQVADRTDKMPFLAEMFSQVALSGVNQNRGARNRKRSMIPRMNKRYPTTQPAEGGLLLPRYVPSELSQFVYTNQLQESGSSGMSVRLRHNTLEGLREAGAVESHSYATTNLRLTNNLEIGVEVSNTLVGNVRKGVQKLQEMDLPDQAKITLLSMVNNVTLLDKAVYDLKSTNNDLLKTNLLQYNQDNGHDQGHCDRPPYWSEESRVSLPK